MKLQLPFRREQRDTLENPSADLVAALTGLTDGRSIAGVHMSPLKSLQLTAVYACVRLLAESVGSLPLPIYRREARSRVRVPEDPRWGLLNDQPNPEMYAMELHETAIAHANLWGRGYVYVVRNNAGMPAELWPLRPDRTRQERTRSGQLIYTTDLDSGEPVTLQPEEVIDIKALFGLSPIRTGREALSSAAAAEEYGGNFWANQARPGGLIELERRMDDDEYQEFRARWNAGHQGLSRSQLVGILTGGMKWQNVEIAPELAQFLGTRQFGIREIARLFHVPPHMIADLEGTVTRASIEQQSLEFIVYSLRPWLVRYESALKMRLFNRSADKAAEVYPEFLLEGLLRGDITTRFSAYTQGIQFGFLSRADARELENLPFVDGLDVFLVPVNMTTSDAILAAPPAPVGGESASALAYLALLLRNHPAGQAVAELATAAISDNGDV